MTPDAPSERLERALSVFLDHVESGDPDPTRLLHRHEDLRDLLEPMLGGGDAAGAADDAGHREAREAAGDVVLGDFRLVREIGRGGMGVVYEAWQRSLDRRVALKTLAPASIDSATAVARFRREAAAVARLRHPGIVEVHGFGADGDRHWLAMEFIDGEPLHRCSKRFRAPAAAVALVAQLAEALQHAHAAGIVHRDVKPANVLVRPDGTAVLTDFGLAADSSLPSVTVQGGFLGTLEYAAPEQVQGRRADERSDIWSLGVVLSELVTGRRPFARDSTAATMRAILEEDAPDPRALADVSPDLAAVIGQALAKEPSHRYATMAAFLADLRALQVGAPVAARLLSPAGRLLRYVRRNPWRAAAVASLALLALALTAAGGWFAANAPRLAAARAAEAAAVRERALGEAWFCLAEEDPGAGLRVLDAFVAAGGEADAEVAIARAFMLRQGDLDAARRAIAPMSGPVAAAVRALLDGEKVDLAALVVTRDPVANFVAGALIYERARQNPDDPGPFRSAAEYCERAVALAEKPRAPFLAWWLLAATFAGDRAGVQAATAGLERHFADSACLRRASAFAQIGVDDPAARKSFEALIAAAAVPEAGLHFNLGVACERLGDFEAAERQYRRAVELQPGHARAWNNLGLLLRRSKDTDGAIAAFRTSVEHAPGHAKAWNNLGIALRARGDAPGAREAFQRAVEAQPVYAIAWGNLGNLQLAAGELDDAIASYRQAVAADPAYVRAQANLGNALRSAGRRDEALLAYVRASEIAPRDLIPHYNVARAALDLGIVPLARRASAQALAIAPDDADAQSIRAEALLAGPEPAAGEALALALRAIERRPAFVEFRLLAARAEAVGGDREAARRRLDALAAGTLTEAERDKVATLRRELDLQ